MIWNAEQNIKNLQPHAPTIDVNRSNFEIDPCEDINIHNTQPRNEASTGTLEIYLWWFQWNLSGKHRPWIEAAEMTLRRYLKCRHTMNKNCIHGRFWSLKTKTRRKKSAKAATIPESPMSSNLTLMLSCSLPNNDQSDHQYMSSSNLKVWLRLFGALASTHFFFLDMISSRADSAVCDVWIC